MPCVRQYIVERIRFDKRKEKKIAESRWNEKSFICFFGHGITRQSLSCERIVFIQEPCESHLKKRQYYYKIKRMITYYNKEQE